MVRGPDAVRHVLQLVDDVALEARADLGLVARAPSPRRSPSGRSSAEALLELRVRAAADELGERRPAAAPKGFARLARAPGPAAAQVEPGAAAPLARQLRRLVDVVAGRRLPRGLAARQRALDRRRQALQLRPARARRPARRTPGSPRSPNSSRLWQMSSWRLLPGLEDEDDLVDALGLVAAAQLGDLLRACPPRRAASPRPPAGASRPAAAASALMTLRGEAASRRGARGTRPRCSCAPGWCGEMP